MLFAKLGCGNRVEEVFEWITGCFLLSLSVPLHFPLCNTSSLLPLIPPFGPLLARSSARAMDGKHPLDKL